MTGLATAARVHSADNRLVGRCQLCGQTLHHVECFDSDVALGTFFHHHPDSDQALHRPDVPAGWRPAP